MVDGYQPGRFSHDQQVYRFAVWCGGEIRCQEYSEGTSDYGLDRTIRVAEFGLPARLIDMDVVAERAVVERSLDFNAYWLLFDFQTATLTNIGPRSDFGFFLVDNVLRHGNRTASDVDRGEITLLR